MLADILPGDTVKLMGCPGTKTVVRVDYRARRIVLAHPTGALAGTWDLSLVRRAER